MSFVLIIVVIVVALSLLFDFLNGFHDAANTITSVVVTRTLSPGIAVLIAGASNFIGFFTFGVAVASTIGKGVIHADMVTLPILVGALLGAIIWNILTWLLGLPTSSSHALIGGLVGSGIAAAGGNIVIIPGLLRIVSFIILAPLLGGIAAALITILVMWIFHRVKPRTADPVFRVMLVGSSILSSIGHGTNDAQKSMGVIALALFAGGLTRSFQLQNWIVISCYTAISLGTMFGGWRIVKTMGTKITKIGPMEGFSSGIAAAAVMMGTAHMGIPVSTTHVIAGTLMGVGSVESAAQVKWVTARKIMWSWLLTIPLTAGFSAGCYSVIRIFLPH
jgi:PiT family inorganic phosphate transporter